LRSSVTFNYEGILTFRDLKLENILLDKAENIKLGDFGFTREYEPKKLLETWCGTYSYAAPEMIQGQKYAAEAVDVWSMGVILYAMLCGELPFDDEDEAVIKERITKRNYSLPDYLSQGNLALHLI
jgi:serine/threonine protein kinase